MGDTLSRIASGDSAFAFREREKDAEELDQREQDEPTPLLDSADSDGSGDESEVVKTQTGGRFRGGDDAMSIEDAALRSNDKFGSTAVVDYGRQPDPDAGTKLGEDEGRPETQRGGRYRNQPVRRSQRGSSRSNDVWGSTAPVDARNVNDLLRGSAFVNENQPDPEEDGSDTTQTGQDEHNQSPGSRHGHSAPGGGQMYHTHPVEDPGHNHMDGEPTDPQTNDGGGSSSTSEGGGGGGGGGVIAGSGGSQGGVRGGGGGTDIFGSSGGSSASGGGLSIWTIGAALAAVGGGAYWYFYMR